MDGFLVECKFYICGFLAKNDLRSKRQSFLTEVTFKKACSKKRARRKFLGKKEHLKTIYIDARNYFCVLTVMAGHNYQYTSVLRINRTDLTRSRSGFPRV